MITSSVPVRTLESHYVRADGDGAGCCAGERGVDPRSGDVRARETDPRHGPGGVNGRHGQRHTQEEVRQHGIFTVISLT